MNPQFCSPLPLRPNFVPVVVRPTVPVWYTSIAQDQSSPVHGVPLFPFGLTPGANFSSQTPIGVDDSKGKAKQGDTLEDFKKLAERNGITVCAPGSKDRAECASLSSCMTPPPDNSNIGHSNEDHNSSSLSRSPQWCGETRQSTSHSSVGRYYNTPNNEKHATEEQNPVNVQEFSAPQFVTESKNNFNSSLCTTDKLSLFKSKAAMSGIKVEEDTDLVVGEEELTNVTPTMTSEREEPKQAVESLAQIPETTTKITDLAVTNEDSVNNLEHTLGSRPLGELDSEVVQLSIEEDEDVDVEIKPEGETCVGENQDESACTCIPGMTQEVEVKNSKEGTEYDIVSNTEDTFNFEHVAVSTKEDAQIAAFEEIARQKGIKVGSVPKNSTSSVTNPGVHRVETAAIAVADGLNACTEQDEQISRFEEMAWLNGIKVGKEKTGRLSAACSESSDSVAPDNVQENELCTEMYSFGEDPQIARFQESAWLRGIKVSGTLSNVSSSSSLSPATSEDYLLCHPSYESHEVATQTKGDTFEELAKRNGIKIGKSVVPSETLNIAGVSADNSHGRLLGNTATSVESIERASIVFNHACTQTEVTTVDCDSQTCENDHGFLKQSTQVQVDAFREAFAEEFMMWKLDESAAEDDVELCYKDLYFKEKKAAEELSESLQNEKDVSANTKHNHKRVMEQLKEELSSKTEEIETLKKDLKTLKKQKETEAKRIMKELKSKEEELESYKGTIKIKEFAIENLNSIIKEQIEKLQFFKGQLQEMKTALLQANEDAQCKTCMNRIAESRGAEEINREEESDAEWAVYTRRKSKSPPFKPLQVEKARDRPSPGSVNERCDLELSSHPRLNRQLPDNPCSRNKFNSLHSLEDDDAQEEGDTKSKAECPTTASVLQGDMPRTSPQSAEASCSPPVNNVLSPPLLSRAEEELQGSAISQSPPAEEQPSVQNSSAFSDGSPLPQNDQHIASKVPNVDAPVSSNTTVSGSTCQQPLNAFFPTRPFALQAMPTQVITRYLSGLVVQPNMPSCNRARTGSAPLLRRPPGLNTEPVPDEEPDQPPPSSSPPAAGKSTYDKLMDALHKRFPNKSRQELVLDLKKAKASTGAAGFKGKQIADVVKCVEKVVKDKQESEVANQAVFYPNSS